MPSNNVRKDGGEKGRKVEPNCPRAQSKGKSEKEDVDAMLHTPVKYTVVPYRNAKRRRNSKYTVIPNLLPPSFIMCGGTGVGGLFSLRRRREREPGLLSPSTNT